MPPAKGVSLFGSRTRTALGRTSGRRGLRTDHVGLAPPALASAVHVGALLLECAEPWIGRVVNTGTIAAHCARISMTARAVRTHAIRRDVQYAD
jgi:hypothetical protein